MINISLSFFVVLMLFSCSESFENINPSEFNKRIKERTDINSPEDLMSLYYNISGINDNPKISVNVSELSENTFEIILIHDGLEDDSQQSEKVIIVAKKIMGRWNVIEIKENWRCWEGRGHTNWSIEPCN